LFEVKEMRRPFGVLLLAGSLAWGAINVTVVWEVRTGGSDTNGGGFKAGATGTDFSQTNSKRTAPDVTNISTTDAVADGSTTITSATANFTAAIVGNVVYFAGGSGTITAQWREVTVYTNSTTVTIDTAIAASTGMTMNIGGALASPGQAAGAKVTCNPVYVAAGTYVLSTASPNVAGGIVADTGTGTAANPNIWEGYQATRGDMGTPPVIQIPASSVDTVTIFSVTGNYGAIRNIKVDGQSKTAITGISLGTHVVGYRLAAINTTVKGIVLSGASGSSNSLLRSSVSGFSGTCGIDGGSGTVIACEAHGGTCTGVLIGATSLTGAAMYCLSYANTGASSYGFSAYRGKLVGCVAYGNGSHGFYSSAVLSDRYLNCISEGNVGYGFAANASSPQTLLMNCAVYNNNGGTVSNFPTTIGLVTGTASFFVLPGSGNFALNTTAGGGAAARATGYPGVFLDGTTTGYLDIGAAQHADPAAGGQKACTFISRLGEKGWPAPIQDLRPPIWAAGLPFIALLAAVVTVGRWRRR
jgi:hypothetical protein